MTSSTLPKAPFRSVLLTGRPGIGKTTVVREVVRQMTSHRLAGFYTEEIREAGERVGFRAVTMGGERKTIARVDLASPHRVGKYGVDVEAIDRLSEATLNLDSGVELYVVDEIGKMECLSEYFVEAVTELLAARAFLIATVAQSGPGLIARAKERSDVILREVTRANRDDLATAIAAWLRPKLEDRAD